MSPFNHISRKELPSFLKDTDKLPPLVETMILLSLIFFFLNTYNATATTPVPQESVSFSTPLSKVLHFIMSLLKLTKFTKF